LENIQKIKKLVKVEMLVKVEVLVNDESSIERKVYTCKPYRNM